MTSQDKQIIVRPTSGDNVREYHLFGTDEQICKLHYAEFWHPMHGADSEFEALGPKGKKIAGTIMAKPYEKSITRLTFRPTSIRVYKSPMADWASVEDDIVIPALKDALGTNFQVVQHGSTKQRELTFA